MKIILGIGNPGAQYADTRHNVGFMAADRYAEKHGLTSWRRRFHSLVAEGTVGPHRVLLMKPDTYVNESGRAVRAAADWCNVSADGIIVVCDDFNLALGRLRVRGKGSSGGHRGLESVAAHLGTDEFPRLRIGIGGVQPERAARDFVLSRFSPADRSVVDAAVERATRALDVWLESGLDRCQNEFNVDPAATSKEP